MAKVYLKVDREFTRRIGVSTVVGHPEHRDPRGRFLELDEDAGVDRLVNGGYASRISKSAYDKGVETARPDAGQTMIDQLAGTVSKLSATASSAEIEARATQFKVDLSGKAKRSDRIKAVNAAIADAGSTAAEDGAEGTDNANSRVGTLTNDTTLHPLNSSPQQADPVRDHAAAVGQPTGNELAADEDAAPTGGGEGGDGAPPAQ